MCFEIETDSEFDFFPDGNTMNAEAQIVEGDSAVGIDGSFEPVTEDIIKCQIRFWNDKGSEETSFFLKGFFKMQRGGFSDR
mgnify:FL=1